MPFYNCIASKHLLDARTKAKLAAGITEIHCRMTGAPRHFVHVVFTPFEDGDAFTAGEPSEFSFIRAGIREGRPVEVKQQMLSELSALWAGVVAKGSADNLLVTFTETGEGNVMEAGMLLPHPKDDEAWKAQHGLQ